MDFEALLKIANSDTCPLCPYDSCHEKIDHIRVQNWVINDHPRWKGARVYQPEKLFSGWLTDFLLFWYQIYRSGSNRTNFTKVLRPKNCQNSEPQRGLLSRDTRHIFTSLQNHNMLTCCLRLSFCSGDMSSLGSIVFDVSVWTACTSVSTSKQKT